MTRTVASRFLVTLHVIATLALCAVAAQMFILGFTVLSELQALISNAPLGLSMPAGLTPAISLAGANELASFAAFPGGPALLVLGIYLSCLEHAVAAGGAPRSRVSASLPAFGMIWSISAAGLWVWSLQSVRMAGYVPTHSGTFAGLVFVGALLCIAAIIHIQSREDENSSGLNKNAAV